EPGQQVVRPGRPLQKRLPLGLGQLSLLLQPQHDPTQNRQQDDPADDADDGLATTRPRPGRIEEHPLGSTAAHRFTASRPASQLVPSPMGRTMITNPTAITPNTANSR